MAKDKEERYREVINSCISSNEFKAKVICQIIKSPKLLNTVFHGERTDFVLYEVGGEFYYLPKSLISKVEET